jgi:hypothetical protein
MTKQEIVSYLAGLLTLMEAQDTSGVHNRSQILGAEYNKHWDILKSTIQQENDDEARKRGKLSDGGNKARYADGEHLPSRSEPNWPGPSRQT